MIIRHDLELVFLRTRVQGHDYEAYSALEQRHSVQELWNYAYSDVLNRYVDQVHLPMSDLCTTYFRYREIQSRRLPTNPYKRLPRQQTSTIDKNRKA